ncbi:MAG: FUN14 domain-containing protein [Candidatus Binatia bacterium]|nr:FUN14 domain-containing protein [Candidatus Binatia bacterium]
MGEPAANFDVYRLLAELPAGQLGFGGLAGLVAGYAAKKVAKLIALLLGVLFFTLQILAYQGWITIHWQEVQRTADEVWREAQHQGWLEQAWGIVTGNLPFGSAFAAGFVLGFRLG